MIRQALLMAGFVMVLAKMDMSDRNVEPKVLSRKGMGNGKLHGRNTLKWDFTMFENI